MTTPTYLRYTLRLAPTVSAAGEAGAAPTAEPEDDWSGAAAYAWRPDPTVLDYRHPAAVSLIAQLEPNGWQEEDDDTLVFWVEAGRRDDPVAVAALAALGELGRLEAAPERTGWDEAWKEFHRPHAVGRLYVRPPWYPARDDLLDIVVDTAQAFGTGGHPTTRQCLAMLQRLAPGALLDLGCGSGVVSLGAARLGFAPVSGVDIDPQAVAEAESNARRNGLAPVFLVGDATDPALALPAADVVVANLALLPILRLAPRFAPGSDGAAPDLRPQHLLLAGLLLEQSDLAAAAFAEYEMVDKLVEGEWLLLHLARLS